VAIDPAPRLARLDLLERGEIVERKVKVMIANLPRHIAERELATALKLLNWNDESGAIEVVTGAPGPGNVLLVELTSEHVTEICTGFGEMRTPAEGVAEKAAKELRRYLAAGVPVGTHLADQLMPLLALGAGGSYRTLPLTRHAQTNADVIRQFVEVGIDVTAETRDVARVDVGKR
jgi:RNA 3'-terminal phosphate cyclase (ATP)